MKSKRILLVEDNKDSKEILSRYLEQEGFEVLTASTGLEGLELAKTHKPDLMVLDVMLPEMDGFEVLRNLKGKLYIPVLLVTARHDDTDKIVGLELGADDYVTKPYNPRELLARIKAILRRVAMALEAAEKPKNIMVGKVELNLNAQELRVEGSFLPLTVTECAILRLLMIRPGQIFARDQILDRVWGEEFSAELRVVDVHIRNLRKKMAPLTGTKQYIHSVRGAGYKFEE